MKTDDPKIAKLQVKVTAAQQEFDLAVAFHEIWKPTAYDRDLHDRLGVSYATQAFRVIRTALRRELILALIRLWDKDGQTIGLESIAKALGKKEVIDALTLRESIEAHKISTRCETISGRKQMRRFDWSKNT